MWPLISSHSDPENKPHQQPTYAPHFGSSLAVGGGWWCNYDDSGNYHCVVAQMINVCPVDMKKLLQRPDFVYDIKVKSNNLEKMPLPSSNSFDGISEKFWQNSSKILQFYKIWNIVLFPKNALIILLIWQCVKTFFKKCLANTSWCVYPSSRSTPVWKSRKGCHLELLCLKTCGRLKIGCECI